MADEWGTTDDWGKQDDWENNEINDQQNVEAGWESNKNEGESRLPSDLNIFKILGIGYKEDNEETTFVNFPS